MKASVSQSLHNTSSLPLFSWRSNDGIFVITVVSLTSSKLKTFNIFFLGHLLILHCRHAHFHDFVWLLLPACLITYRRYKILFSTSGICEDSSNERFHTVSTCNYFPTFRSNFCSYIYCWWPPNKTDHTVFFISQTSYRPITDRNTGTDREALNSPGVHVVHYYDS